MLKNYQTAIVTGASHGIGPFIVRALAKEGMNIVLAARSGNELEQVATSADIRATGVQVLTVATDVTQRDARSALVSAAERTFGSVDVLVNNAGGDLQREFHRYTVGEVEALIALNLTGPIELTRLLLPGMLQRGRGHIVNISSLGGSVGFPYTEVYSAAKDGLIAFTRVLRADYRKQGVSSSVLILGPIGGAGTGARTMEELNLAMSAMAKASMSPPEAVAQAVLKSIKRDKAELVVMPGPGRLIRTLMTFFPGMGPAMNEMTGSTQTMKQVADLREQQRAQAIAGVNSPVQQR
ncbi:MAG TPA: SDR family oxidoreductase [Ktedonobacteraceae bacterium]|nr:SDR family oxidoreductase [Ktedonobacteraceae bacterium]